MHCINQQSAMASAVTLALAATLLSPTALAQTRVLEEAIVTAQKRAESSQDIPVALTAIGSDMIDKIGLTQTQDLVKLAPSLTVGGGVGDNKQNSGFSLRGVGTNVFSIGVEQSVAVILDDVSTVQAGQALANLVDIERVEVLRGPQSTLFGKSASAGVISVVTKSPAEEFEGSIELSLTDENEQRVLASISGPISKSLGYRLTGNWSDRDGYVNNLSINEDVNGEESSGLRGKLRWDISETIQADLTGYWSEGESTCCTLTWRDLDPNAQVFGVVPGELAPGIKPSDDNLDFRSEDGPTDETDSTGANLRVTVELGEFTLTSITATNNWDYSNDGDVDFSNVDVFSFFSAGALSGGFFSQAEVETEFFSQEFRLTSPSYDNFEYLIGLYYADAEADRTFLRNPGLPVIPSDWEGSSGTESMAFFGQATWRFSEATSITAGLRWNDEEISADFVNKLVDPTATISGNDSDSEVLGNLSVQHFFTEDVMFYARYATGYKGQAYDITTSFNTLKAENPAAPETSDAYEIGVKSALLDNRLQLNVTAFFTEYQDYQAQSSTVLPDGSLLATLNNVGVLETQGVELEGVVLIGDNLTLSFGAAYIDAVIEEFTGADCYSGQTEAEGCVGGTQDISGGDLPNSPEWKWSIVADYQVELGNMPFYGFTTLSYVWQDEVNFTLLQNPLSGHDSYGVGDFSIGINDKANDRYRLTAFVNNVTDENYSATIADFSPLFGGARTLLQSLPRNSQRYYGIRVKFSF